jgi:hypothetical protein
MVAGLRESIESLGIPPQSAAVVEVAQQYSALGAKLTMALAELDRRLELELGGTVEVTDSTGRVRTSDPPGQAAVA